VCAPTNEPRFPIPVPNGWFIVSEARALAPGDVQASKAYGTDVVLFRGQDGAPHMIEAYCAHLGAHIGVGGVNGPEAARRAAAGFSAGVAQDPPIWEDKRYVERLVVTKRKEVARAARVGQQFYSDYEG
jgi:Rieske [2Fe-2S] domain